MRFALRACAGVALLAALVWLSDPAMLWRQLRGVNLGMFAIAVAVGLVSNVLSAVRWRAIASRLGLQAPMPPMILMYAQGMTANTFLPGAPVAGDVLRSWQLSRLGNPMTGAALSVFLDRFSGLWILCGISLAASLYIALAQASGAGSRMTMVHGVAYLAALAAAVSLPFLPSPLRFASFLERVSRARRALLASAGYSFGVQLASCSALWLCALAAGLDLPYPLVIAAAAPVFIVAALPIGVAGFGAREMGALLAFGALGVPREQAMATSLLYGIASVIQGLVAAPGYFARLR